MIGGDDGIRDERLAAALRPVLGNQTAPESWVRSVLEIPTRLRNHERQLRQQEPLYRAILPQLSGMVVALSIGTIALLKPDLLQAGFSLLRARDSQMFGLPTGVHTLAIVLIIADGARGFRTLRRWLL